MPARGVPLLVKIRLQSVMPGLRNKLDFNLIFNYNYLLNTEQSFIKYRCRFLKL